MTPIFWLVYKEHDLFDLLHLDINSLAEQLRAGKKASRPRMDFDASNRELPLVYAPATSLS